MRIAVDAHAIGRHLTGNEVYVRSLLNAFAAQNRNCEFVAYVSADDARQYIPSRIRTRRVSANPFLRLGFDLAMKVREDRPDLLHVQYTAPIGCSVPVVVSVHDVSFLEHPEYFTRDRAWQLQWTVRRTVSRAAKILTGSEFSRSSILKVYGDLEEDKVVVVPNAAASEFRPIAREAATATVRERFSIGVPFLLSVGDIQPRKNQIGLIRAFARLVRAYPQFKQNLVLAGKETWFAGRVHEAAQESGVADRIQFFGFVSDSDLLQLYNACDLFVFPSFYEGFGLPALEAMACGRAVVCSNTSALPEVVDGAAIVFDPYSVDEMVRAIADLLLDSELRLRMERLGTQRAAHFSWQKTAQRTLEVFHEVVERPSTVKQQVGSPTIAHR
ncbi:MAG TPA: glycosyltransferase family 1 protein [Bryobacteraceae bacterium]|jgi:glycosyltransferase involved in cell wall biosynthesis|nr:glycosyltransferase family 1 protein [Bryobacteraceae bacterium]